MRNGGVVHSNPAIHAQVHQHMGRGRASAADHAALLEDRGLKLLHLHLMRLESLHS